MTPERWRQLGAILRIEWKKSFWNRRAWWIYVVALLPAVAAGLHSLIELRRGEWRCTLQSDSEVFAGIFQVFYLRLGIFFGCVGLFSGLLRGELLTKTLHYYFLAPVRRELVVAGKYLAGVLAASTIFGVSVGLTFYLITYHFGHEQTAFFATGPGTSHLASYLLATVLACFGYGAVFLAAGLLVRNPLIPAAVIMVWEAGNNFLPELLQKISVIHYLKSLCPVPVPLDEWDALLAIAADPTPAPLAVAGLLCVTALVLVYAARRARRTEVHYGE